MGFNNKNVHNKYKNDDEMTDDEMTDDESSDDYTEPKSKPKPKPKPKPKTKTKTKPKPKKENTFSYNWKQYIALYLSLLCIFCCLIIVLYGVIFNFNSDILVYIYLSYFILLAIGFCSIFYLFLAPLIKNN